MKTKLAKNFCIVFALFLTQSIFAASDSSIVEQRFDFRIRTANIDSTFQKIIELAEEKGGYFTRFDGNNLSLRFPAKALDEFNATLGSIAEIEAKAFQSFDKSSEIERLDSQIQSRKKLLEEYINLVKNAPFAELQSVEREMVKLNAEIERLQGQKLAIEKRAALALVTIISDNFNLHSRPVNNAISPFVWINSTNLNSLQRDF